MVTLPPLRAKAITISAALMSCTEPRLLRTLERQWLTLQRLRTSDATSVLNAEEATVGAARLAPVIFRPFTHTSIALLATKSVLTDGLNAQAATIGPTIAHIFLRLQANQQSHWRSLWLHKLTFRASCFPLLQLH